MIIWLLACAKPATTDSVPPDSGCVVGSMPGGCASDFTLESRDGTPWTLSDHDPAIVSVSVMWVPAWQDSVRALDTLHQDTGVATVDVLVQDLSGQPADADDAALWSDSLGLSMTVLLSDSAFLETWDDPATDGPYAVLVEGGLITWRGTEDEDVDLLRERLTAR